MSNKIIVKHYFDASHQLKDCETLVTKACARLHGHTYKVETEMKIVNGDLNESQMVIDFKAVKQIIDTLDHQHINDIFKEYDFSIEWQPTAERIAEFIFTLLRAQLPKQIHIEYVKVCEGYKGEDKASWAIYS